ncbi:hypothetical protein C671_1862 [[Clostridium] bifermentans ATCC 19299]|uniref:DUF4179 domain-containing protein n=1 Tax=Paraclostridium bifermentans TaxID=1490 RepID=UPI00038D3414|nr:DUF4179 domain-containing protein [Paraclostridium bifermentans]EQK45329.1 hypothetical protein C671_1862 [[Clostridium] bifermentans ATCC 19299] [Paraclostridium bifermentans ATCC 19299]
MNKRKKSIKIIVITSSISLVLIGGLLIFNDEGSSQVKDTFSSIASNFGLDSDLNEYKKAINNPITNNDYTITLNKVILDKNELTISSTVKSDNGGFNGYPEMLESVFINGTRINSDSNGNSEMLNDSTMNKVTTYFLDKELSGEVNVRVEYPGIQMLDDTGSETVKGDWSFNFYTNADALVKDTLTVNLNKKFKLEDGKIIKLSKYISNSLGTKIEFSLPTDGTEYLMKLAGNDNLGNKVEFYCDYSNNGKGIFKLDNSHKSIKKDSSKLNLSLYTSDSSNNKWKKVGSDFDIDLK